MLETFLNHIFSKGIKSYNHLSGGDINEVIRAKVNDDSEVVVKINSASKFPKMLEIEAKSLHFLSIKGINVPKPLKNGIYENQQYLVLEYINSSSKSSEFWKDFANELAKLHQVTQAHFGFEFNNYIGSLPQSNTAHETWDEFFINERCIPQVKMAADAGLLNSREIKSFSNFYKEVLNIWPKEKPALLHGDLWSGNYMVGNEGEPVFIDPAIYYGHREMDIGMMRLFGGFHPELFEEYNELYPLETGWESRIKYNQLYYLLVHLNLFGLGYKSQVMEILKKF